MKKLFCLVLALVLTVSCLGGVCFAADPIALVINGDTETEAYTTKEIKALISEDGTTVVKMLRDHVETGNSFLYSVPTFTLDLNGFTAGSSEASAVGVQKLGTKNTTTVVKNGTLIGGRKLNNCIRVDVGGFRLENVTATAACVNAIVGIYQAEDTWNDDIVITGCTILGHEAAAVGFTHSKTSQEKLSVKIENTILLNSKLGGNWGTYPIYQRDVQGGTVVLGKNVHIYTHDRINWIDPNLKHTGETVTYQGQDGAFAAPALDLSFTNLHHWSTPDGGMTNPTGMAIPNTPPAEKAVTSVPAKTVALFKDVPTSHWAFEDIDTAYGAGLVTEKRAGKYAPKGTVTRGEFLAAVLQLISGEEGGLGDGNPDATMTREEMALVLYGAAVSLQDCANVEAASAESIPDSATIGASYQDAVLWCYGAGLLVGMDANGTFAPQDKLTRAQSATVLARLMAKTTFHVEHLIPEQDVADTTENRQKAVIDYAWAYYYKNPYIQYDVTHLCKVGGRKYGDRTAARMNATPEMSGPHRTTYAHCQFYGYCVIYQSFGHEMTGSWETCTTKPVVGRYPAVKPYEVFYYETNGNAEDTKAAMEEMFAMAQPGDILSYTRTNTDTPHVVVYTGDLNGDGIADMLHVGGTDYEKTRMMEVREPMGAVMFTSWRNPSITGIYEFFMDLEKSYDPYTKIKQVTLTRYTDEKHAATDPLTDHAKSRLLFPKMDISFTVDAGVYGSVVKGNELTYTLNIKNNSQQDHKGIEVNFPVPKNAKVIKIDGQPVSCGIVSWKLDIPAGKEVTHTYTVKATGNVGSIVDTGVGYVHAIPMPVYTTSVISGTEDAVKVNEALEASKASTGLDFVNGYLAAMGKTFTLPALNDLRTGLFTENVKLDNGIYQLTAQDKLSAEYAPFAQMMVPYYFGGQSVATECESLRVKELRAKDMLPGDILLWQENATKEAKYAVHNGEAFVYSDGSEVLYTHQIDLDKFTRYDFFLCLRPNQAQ